jgi:hypothetical protein
VACGGDDDGEDAADGTTTTAEDATTTTLEDDLTTGTTASTASDETTTTAAPITQPPVTSPPATQPTPTTASGPRVDSVSASPADCDGSGQTTLTWATTGAVSVEVSIDNENGTFQDGLPPDGSGEFPGACAGDTQIYFVKAIAANGQTSTRSVTATS